MSDTTAPTVGQQRLVLLAKELKRITGEDPNVTIKEARTMDPARLEEQLRAFGSWYRSHAESTAQSVEQAIWAALDDEENDPSSATRRSGRNDCQPRRHAGFAAAHG